MKLLLVPEGASKLKSEDPAILALSPLPSKYILYPVGAYGLYDPCNSSDEVPPRVTVLVFCNPAS